MREIVGGGWISGHGAGEGTGRGKWWWHGGAVPMAPFIGREEEELVRRPAMAAVERAGPDLTALGLREERSRGGGSRRDTWILTG